MKPKPVPFESSQNSTKERTYFFWGRPFGWNLKNYCNAAQKMKFSIKGFFSKCEQIREKLRIWSHLLKKSLMENFIFCAV